MKTSQKIIVVSCTCLLVIVSVGCAAAARKLYTAKAERRAAKEAAQNIEKEIQELEKEVEELEKEQAQREAEGKKEVITEEQPQAKGKKIAIDPGHQGPNVDMSDLEPMGPGSQEMKAKASSGTQGRYTNVPEYELTLNISKQLRLELEQRGYEVVLTREDHDTAISNSERALMAAEEGSDIYVRIHANGSEDPLAKGAMTLSLIHI